MVQLPHSHTLSENATMHLPKVCAFEAVTALALMGFIHLYLVLRLDFWLINPAFVLGELVALYAVTAVASEAAIASSLRPTAGQLFRRQYARRGDHYAAGVGPCPPSEGSFVLGCRDRGSKDACWD